MSIAAQVKERLRGKERKQYTEEAIDDEEIEGRRLFCVDEKLHSTKYNSNFVRRMKGEDFTLKYVQKNGFHYPHVFHDKAGLGMRIPSKNFQVSDVKQCVGSRRNLDVMDVTTQKGLEMSMKDWVKYFENPNRDRLLNVISLEFSHTRLENYVESPTVVRQVDWVDRVWPQHMKECQTESTNLIEKMKYPKVQKYCLMSVKGCYTDFHIDFGGTSVWYHILHGEKVFWLIPPSEKNLCLYEDWVLSGKQGDIFFADQVAEGQCERICLHEGYTFMIPTGWIHAVYTPKDSLVFGGNFLHSYHIIKQLRIADIEDKTHVPQKFRYPFYTEISWYVLERYVHCVTGKRHRKLEEKREQTDVVKPEVTLSVSGSQPNSPITDDIYTPTSPRSPMTARSPRNDVRPLSPAVARSPRQSEALSPGAAVKSPRHDAISPASPRVIVTNLKPEQVETVKQELQQQSAVKYEEISSSVIISAVDVKEQIPVKLEQAGGGDAVMDNPAKKPIYLTKYELEGLRALVHWLHNLPSPKKFIPKDIIDPLSLLKDVKQMLKDHADDEQELSCTGEPPLKFPESELKKLKQPKPRQSSGMAPGKTLKTKNQSSGVRRRRTRCKKCEACTRTDCSECHFCKDMKKYGGPGKMKQSCISRQCMAPVLPNTAICMICGKDERIKVDSSDDTITTLMECGICWEIVHPNCLRDKYENLTEEGVVNEDLPNSWECAKCCQGGKQGQLKPRVPKGLSKLTKRSDVLLSSPGSESHVDEIDNHDDFHMNDVESKENVNFEQPQTKRVKLNDDEESSDRSTESVAKDAVSTACKRPVSDSQNTEHTMSLSKTDAIQTPAVDATDDTDHSHGTRKRLKSMNDEMDSRTLPACDVKDSVDTKSSETISGKRLNNNKQIRSPLQPKYPKLILERFAIRPAPIAPPPDSVLTTDDKKHPLNREHWMSVFKHLSHADLSVCLAVCKTWNRWCINRILWSEIDCSNRRVMQQHLMGIVRRQPKQINLERANVSYKQLLWLLSRLPHLKHLNLTSCSWGGAAALCTPDCPYLESLNLDWVEGVRDEAIKDLLSACPTRRPAVRDNSCHLRNMVSISLVGTDISDESLSVIGHTLRSLYKLDISYCMKITDAGIETFCAAPAGKTIGHLTAVGCKQISADCLPAFKHCTNIYHINLKSCRNVTRNHLQKFISAPKNKLFKLVQDKILYRE